MQNAAALMDGFDMDIDSSGEKVSNAELAAVLAEIGLEDKKKPLQKTKPAAASAPAPAPRQQPPPTPAPPAGSAAAPPSLEERMNEFKKAAVVARQAGDMETAKAWLRRSKEFQAAIDAMVGLLLVQLSLIHI